MTAIEVTDLPSEINETLLATFTGERTGFVEAGPERCLLPVKYRDHAAEFSEFKLRPDDIWIVTYPRSGTLIMQEMLWLLANNLNYEAASEQALVLRSRFLEIGSLMNDDFVQELLQRVQGDEAKEKNFATLGKSRVPLIDAAKSPRVIKTHLPFSLLPQKLLDTCKVIYVSRNPKDVAVSYFHHNRRMNVLGYKGDFPEFWDLFQNGLVVYGSHLEHIAQAWKHREHPNLLFLFYEDIITDRVSTISRAAEHIGKHFTREQLERLSDHLSIDNFKCNKAINDPEKDDEQLPGLVNSSEQSFIRKGQSGGWSDYFTPEMNEKCENWIAKMDAKTPGFAFPTV